MVTPLQTRVYGFIRDYLAQHGYSPTLAETAVGIGISASSISLISRSVRALVSAGKLRFARHGYRNLQLPEVPDKQLNLPILGKIAAGAPIEAVADKQMLNIHDLFASPDHFVLQVQGDSMIEEGIFNNDWVICKATANAQEKDIVVALIDKHEATLKRISYQLKGYVTLIPANPLFKPKAYAPERIDVQGVFVGLIRVC